MDARVGMKLIKKRFLNGVCVISNSSNFYFKSPIVCIINKIYYIKIKIQKNIIKK